MGLSEGSLELLHLKAGEDGPAAAASVDNCLSLALVSVCCRFKSEQQQQQQQQCDQFATRGRLIFGASLKWPNRFQAGAADISTRARLLLVAWTRPTLGVAGWSGSKRRPQNSRPAGRQLSFSQRRRLVGVNLVTWVAALAVGAPIWPTHLASWHNRA